MTGNQDKRLRNRGRLLLCAALAALGMSGAALAQSQPGFALIAGGWTGDGGPATAANLHGAADVAFDKAGNLYVAQFTGNRIRKITPAGVITTVAGGNTGFAGDGGPASQALIDRPQSLAFDAAGNLYFTDAGNRRVRRIATNGTISTVAGNGSYVSSGDGGQAINAGFALPGSVAVDASGNLFVSDIYANVVRKITPAGVISTYAGTGVAGYSGDNGSAKAAQLSGPSGVATDAAGNLYIADTGNGAVRFVSTAGTITTFMGPFGIPDDVEVDANGAVYVGDDCDLYRFVGTTGIRFGNTGECGRSPDGTLATQADFGYVDGVAVTPNGDIYFADGDNARVAKITAASGLISTYAGVPLAQADGTAALSGTLSITNALAVDNAGNVFISERYSGHAVRKLSAGKLYNLAGNGADGWKTTCAAPCSALSFYLPNLSGVAATTAGHVFIADRTLNRVLSVKNGTVSVFAGGGASSSQDAPVPATQVKINPRSIATDADDNLYIADYIGMRIRKVDPTGVVSTIAGNGSNTPHLGEGGPAVDAAVVNPMHVSVDTAGNVYFYEEGTHAIRRLGTDGRIDGLAGVLEYSGQDPNPPGGFWGEGGSAYSALLGKVTGLAAHSSGVYFTSECGVRRIRPNGIVETLKAFPNCALGLAVKGRFLYVSSNSGRILRAQLPRITQSDFNGDFKSDLIWRASTGTNVMWLGADSATTQTIATNPPEWKLVGQGDFDGDGKSDLVWRNTVNGTNTIWRAGNTNTRIAVTTLADQAWTVAGVGDFDGDGKSDLFWRNTSTGAQQVWYSGIFTTRLAVTTLADMRWIFAGVGDFDGDGKSDLLWRHSVTGGNAIWRNANSQAPRPIAAVNPVWKIAAVADFNGDGASDILWRNSTSGANTIWRSANNTKVQAVVGVTNLNWKVVAAADFENDGSADLIWRDVTTGANTMWRNANNATQKAVSTTGIGWSVQPYEAQP
ncbi:FG-GAP-like repeat-containing protein [Lysobacter sp. 2RAF19]